MQGVKWPSIHGHTIDLVNTVMKRINEASGTYKMFGVLCDVILLRKYVAHYLQTLLILLFVRFQISSSFSGLNYMLVNTHTDLLKTFFPSYGSRY